MEKFIYEPNQKRNHKILKVLQNNGFNVNALLFEKCYQGILVYKNKKVEGWSVSLPKLKECYKQVTLEELLIGEIIEHPEIKIGCKTVSFDDDGIFIKVDGEKIHINTVKKIYDHMLKLSEQE